MTNKTVTIEYIKNTQAMRNDLWVYNHKCTNRLSHTFSCLCYQNEFTLLHKASDFWSNNRGEVCHCVSQIWNCYFHISCCLAQFQVRATAHQHHHNYTDNKNGFPLWLYSGLKGICIWSAELLLNDDSTKHCQTPKPLIRLSYSSVQWQLCGLLTLECLMVLSYLCSCTQTDGGQLWWGWDPVCGPGLHPGRWTYCYR